jgi:sugar fermentation stimulation protein A
MFYKFEKELKEAVVVCRPNRFVMEIIVNGKKVKAHCPVTGRIGNFDFKNTPCLISTSDNKNRKTKFTVEAISPNKPEAKRKHWIGINQGKTNAYVEYFLQNGYFAKMIKNGNRVVREKKLGNSRIDFKVDDNFIEVKTFLEMVPYGQREILKNRNNSVTLDRLIKHFTDLSLHVKKNNGKAIVLLCYVYNAKPFIPPVGGQRTEIGKTVRQAIKKGVENWQVNLKITPRGVYFREYFKLNLF